jgi:hypothetical protein
MSGFILHPKAPCTLHHPEWSYTEPQECCRPRDRSAFGVLFWCARLDFERVDAAIGGRTRHRTGGEGARKEGIESAPLKLTAADGINDAACERVTDNMHADNMVSACYQSHQHVFSMLSVSRTGLDDAVSPSHLPRPLPRCLSPYFLTSLRRPRVARSRAQNLLVIHPTLHLFCEKAVDELVALDRPQASKLLQAPYHTTFQTLHTRTAAVRLGAKGQHMAAGLRTCAAMRLLAKMFALPR